MISLRDYQLDLKNKAREAFKHYKRVILLAPCGSGKTITSTSIISDSVSRGKIVWFIVHRKELLDQAITTLERCSVPMDNVRVYMIQSLANRLNKIEEYPDLIILDECQHSTSNTYLRLLEAYPRAFVLGLTATPTRLSGQPLGDIFEAMVSSVTTEELIKRGFLASYDYYAPKINADFSKVKIKVGDFIGAEIEKELDKSTIYGDIIENYKKLADNKKTIIYCATIEYSKKIEKLFLENGYAIKHFDGKTPKDERDQIIKDFRDDKI